MSNVSPPHGSPTDCGSDGSSLGRLLFYLPTVGVAVAIKSLNGINKAWPRDVKTPHRITPKNNSFVGSVGFMAGGVTADDEADH